MAQYVTQLPQDLEQIRVLTADRTRMNSQLLAEALARDGQLQVTGIEPKATSILAAVTEGRPDVVVLMFTTSNDRDDNSSNMRPDGYYKPYLVQAADGTWRFAGLPVPKSRQAYFTDDPLVKNLWLARLAVTGYIYVSHPKITVPDPTEQLVGMLRDFVESRGSKLLVGLEYRDEKLQSYLQAQKIRYALLEGAEAYLADGRHWTPKGHALVADRLKTLLLAAGVGK